MGQPSRHLARTLLIILILVILYAVATRRRWVLSAPPQLCYWHHHETPHIKNDSGSVVDTVTLTMTLIIISHYHWFCDHGPNTARSTAAVTAITSIGG
jgi:hypothetical protein